MVELLTSDLGITLCMGASLVKGAATTTYSFVRGRVGLRGRGLAGPLWTSATRADDRGRFGEEAMKYVLGDLEHCHKAEAHAEPEDAPAIGDKPNHRHL